MADYYVRATGGSDANSGTTFALGWATIPHAITNTTTNDRVFLCSDVSNKFSLTTGITNFPFSREWIGADLSTGAAYNGTGRAYIIATVPMGSMCGTPYHSNMLYQDIDFDANNQANVAFDFPTWTSTMRNTAFVNCVFQNALNDGLYINCSSATADRIDPLIFYDCEIKGCARYGVYNVVSGGLVFDNCSIHHNNSYNYYGTGSNELILQFHNCRIFRSTTNSGLNIVGSTPVTMTNCILFDNASHGMEFTTETLRVNIRNTIFANNGGYGLTAVSGLNSGWYYGDYNCYYSNTSGAVGPTINGGVVPGAHNVTSDPLFVSTVNNSEDFELQVGSPCLDVGKGFEGGQ